MTTEMSSFICGNSFPTLHYIMIKESFGQICEGIFGTSTTLERSTTHPKFDPTGIGTHDLHIMKIHFVTETPALITWP